MWTKPGHTACKIFKKMGLCNFVFCVRMLLFLFSSFFFSFSGFDPQRSKFHMAFKIFVNMFWRAEGFGRMWVAFDFGSFNKLCLVFSFE